MPVDAVQLQNGKRLTLRGLRGACRLFGGVKAVAGQCEVHYSALGKWLKGNPALAPDKTEAVLNALRLPGGEPISSEVIVWSFKVYWDDIQDAVKLYFPDGAEVVRTPWSRPGLNNASKFLRYLNSGLEDPPELFLISDGRTRAAFRQSPGFLVYEDQLGEGFRMRGRSAKDCQFRVGPHKDAWFTGTITPEMFDDAFASRFVGWDEVAQAAEDNGIDSNAVYEWLQDEKHRT